MINTQINYPLLKVRKLINLNSEVIIDNVELDEIGS